MNKIIIKSLVTFLIITSLIIPSACKPPAVFQPEVRSLEIIPVAAGIGEPVTVTVNVENIGDLDSL